MKAIARCFLMSLVLAAPIIAWGAGTNHNFARWEREISAYERADATNPPPKGVAVFIGSSTVRLWKTLAQDFPGQPVVNRGFGGSQIVDSTHFAERVIFPYEPRQVFLRAGGNDLAAGKTPEQICADFKEFAAKVHVRLPAAQIIFISQSPSLARWKQHEQEKTLNALAADFVRTQPYLKYIETYDLVFGTNGLPRRKLFVADRLHFNSEGYKLMADRVRPFLSK